MLIIYRKITLFIILGFVYYNFLPAQNPKGWKLPQDTLFQEEWRNVDPSHYLTCIADFNGDGKTDVFWQHITTGWTYIWFMNGATLSSTGVPAQVSDSNWQIMN
jgi:hypothetical protein